MGTLISEIFGFNWHRFTIPGVIAGLVLLVVGMAVLIASNSITNLINDKRVESGKEANLNVKFIFYAIAGILVLTGALLAVFMAE